MGFFNILLLCPFTYDFSRLMPKSGGRLYMPTCEIERALLPSYQRVVRPKKVARCSKRDGASLRSRSIEVGTWTVFGRVRIQSRWTTCTNRTPIRLRRRPGLVRGCRQQKPKDFSARLASEAHTDLSQPSPTCVLRPAIHSAGLLEHAGIPGRIEARHPWRPRRRKRSVRRLHFRRYDCSPPPTPASIRN